MTLTPTPENDVPHPRPCADQWNNPRITITWGEDTTMDVTVDRATATATALHRAAADAEADAALMAHLMDPHHQALDEREAAVVLVRVRHLRHKARPPLPALPALTVTEEYGNRTAYVTVRLRDERALITPQRARILAEDFATAATTAALDTTVRSALEEDGYEHTEALFRRVRELRPTH